MKFKRPFQNHVLAAALLFVVAGLASGCYTSKPLMPSNAKSIALPVFGNKTYHDDYTRHLEVDVTDSARKAFLENGMLKILGREEADLIMEGDVIKTGRSILRSDKFGDPQNVQFIITARISLYDVKAAKYVFKDMVINNSTERTESGVYNMNRGENEDLGRTKAIEDLGRNIAHRVLDLW